MATIPGRARVISAPARRIRFAGIGGVGEVRARSRDLRAMPVREAQKVAAALIRDRVRQAKFAAAQMKSLRGLGGLGGLGDGHIPTGSSSASTSDGGSASTPIDTNAIVGACTAQHASDPQNIAACVNAILTQSGHGITFDDPLYRAPLVAALVRAFKPVGGFGIAQYPQQTDPNGITAQQIVQWGLSTPQALWLTPIEITAIISANGWVRGTCGGSTGTCVFNLFDARYYKAADGSGWINRNHPESPLGPAVATSSDPSHTIVGTVTSDLADIGNAIVNFIGTAAGDLLQILEVLGEDALAVIELLGWLLATFAKDVFNPAQFITDINPLKPGSAAYKLVMGQTPGGTGPVDLLGIVLFGPLAFGMTVVADIAKAAGGAVHGLGALNSFNAFNGGVSSLFTDHPNVFTSFLQNLVSAASAPSPKSIFDGVTGAMSDIIKAFIPGIQISAPATVEIALLLVTNIPLPPFGSIIETLLADPMVQKSLGVQGGGAGSIIPIAATCFKANSADQYLSCAAQVLEWAFPGLVNELQNVFFVNLNDLRVIVAALWASGGDLPLMLDNDKFPGVHDALVSTGVLGIAHVAGAFGTNVDSFVSSLKSVLPSDLLDILQTGEQFVFKVVAAGDAALTHHGGLHGWAGLGGLAAFNDDSSASLANRSSLPLVTRRAIWHLQQARWNVLRASMTMRLDEYVTEPWTDAKGAVIAQRVQDVSLFRLMKVDPNDASKGLIPEGQDLVNFLVNKFGAPIAHFFADLIGGSGGGSSTPTSSSSPSIPHGPASTAVNVGGPKFTPAPSKGLTSGQSSAPAPAKKSHAVAGALAAGTAGFFVGGPVGAGVGALIGALIGASGAAGSNTAASAPTGKPSALLRG